MVVGELQTRMLVAAGGGPVAVCSSGNCDFPGGAGGRGRHPRQARKRHCPPRVSLEHGTNRSALELARSSIRGVREDQAPQGTVPLICGDDVRCPSVRPERVSTRVRDVDPVRVLREEEEGEEERRLR